MQPTINNSTLPSLAHSSLPSHQPSMLQSEEPSMYPSSVPSVAKSLSPSMLESAQPSLIPTDLPSLAMSDIPSNVPSHQPSMSSESPSYMPSASVSTLPSIIFSNMPSLAHSSLPSHQPSMLQSEEPSMYPSSVPSVAKSLSPSMLESAQPSLIPTDLPSLAMSDIPSNVPSHQPSMSSESPSKVPSSSPSLAFSVTPSVLHSDLPSLTPSDFPSHLPSFEPSILPSSNPSVLPSAEPSSIPSFEPSRLLSMMHSSLPSFVPSQVPSSSPSLAFSVTPSVLHSDVPSLTPSDFPSHLPSFEPSLLPSSNPSVLPSAEPSSIPSFEPSRLPSMMPSAEPSLIYSSVPSVLYSDSPSVEASGSPSSVATASPSLLASSSPTVNPTVYGHTNLPSLSESPTLISSFRPSIHSSSSPSYYISRSPSSSPSINFKPSLSGSPSKAPTANPSYRPSPYPTESLTFRPSTSPSHRPSKMPSFSPTLKPTSLPSDEPTNHPSTSSRPSLKPSLIPSSNPSHEPSTSVKPSLDPTSPPTFSEFASNYPSQSIVPSSYPSKIPSSRPTLFPTMLRSQFEGDFCRKDIECYHGSCIKNSCKSREIRIGVVLPNEPYSNLMHSPGKWSKVNSDSVQTGGLVIEPEDTFQLYGSMQVYFEFTQDVPVNKETRIRFTIFESKKAKNIGLCLYGDFTGDFEKTYIYCISLFGSRLSVSHENIMSTRKDASLNGKRPNIALGQATYQSSLIQPGYSDLAVDGNIYQIFRRDNWELNTVTSTKREKNPWWEVHLQEESLLREVIVYKRIEDYIDDLFDFTLTIYSNDDLIVFRKVYIDTALAVLKIPLPDVIGKRLRISLNGGYERVLSLAEVEVYDNSYLFDIPVGFLLSFPTSFVNRIAFIQDDIDKDNRSYTIRNVEIYEKSVPEIRNPKIIWVQRFEFEALNIQGNILANRSDNGRYIALRSNSNDILSLAHGKSYIYNRSRGQLKSLGVSDDGKLVAGFAVSSYLGLIQLFDASDMQVPLDEKVWMNGYGSSVAINNDSTMVAVGSPNERTVYTYSLTGGSFHSEKRIKLINSDVNDFGSKVALSENGETIAIASPHSHDQVRDVEVGGIHVYVLVNERWIPVAVILYGRDSMRRLGVGGLAVDDKNARVDAIDENEIYSFEYIYECLDSHAVTVGTDGNKFRPRCQCMSGFETYGPTRGKILKEGEVCLPCLGDSGACEDRPTAAPTAHPTVSIAPSTNPTLSNFPSFQPTHSMTPSMSPTTSYPSLKPSTSSAPSDFPSDSPTSYGSLFDGEPCRIDWECTTFVCNNGLCGGKSLAIKVPLDEFQDEILEANLVLPLPNFSNKKNGGITVMDKNNAQVFGETFRIFELSESFLFNKDTRLQIRISTFDADTIVKFCLYESLEDARESHQCLDIINNFTPNDGIGGLLENRKTKIRFIAFQQYGSTSLDYGSWISGIRIIRGENTAIIGDDGKCVDQHAKTVKEETETRCICELGYVASNGGRVQGQFDVCVACSSSSHCFFEGDFCFDNDECDMGICDYGVCKLNDINGLIQNGQSLSNFTASLDVAFSSDGINSSGGIRVENPWTMRIFGETDKIYYFHSPIYIDKYSSISFDIDS